MGLGDGATGGAAPLSEPNAPRQHYRYGPAFLSEETSGIVAGGAFRCLPPRPVRFSTASCDAVAFLARRTVGSLMLVSAAMARFDFSGLAAIAASAPFPAGSLARRRRTEDLQGGLNVGVTDRTFRAAL